MSQGMLTLSKWGNSLSVRLPQKLLNQFGLSQDDKFEFSATAEEIILKPVKKQTAIQKLFEGYDSSQPYPYEIVDKGGAIGEELY